MSKTTEQVYTEAKEQVDSIAANLTTAKGTGIMWDTEQKSPTFSTLMPEILTLVQRYRDKFGKEPTHVRLNPSVKVTDDDVETLHKLGLNVVQYGLPYPSYLWVGTDPITPYVELRQSLGKQSVAEAEVKTPSVDAPPVSEESSVIRSIFPIGHQTLVLFRTGEGYLFDDIPADVVANWQSAESKGKFWNQNIKGKFTGTKTT